MTTTSLPKASQEFGLVLFLPLNKIRPSKINDKLYRPVDPCDPEIVALAKSIRELGLLETIVISRDYFIISGHRRYCAARLAGLSTVPCRQENIRSTDAGYLTMLREFNRQREKSLSEKLREEIVSFNPEESYRALTEHRQRESAIEADYLTIQGGKTRAKISPAKMPFLRAVQGIIERLRKFWPLSDRVIHYQLLNVAPLIHASKPDSTYKNTPQSYKALTDLLTRARLEGHIAMNVIADPTRPVSVWNVFADSNPFIRQELDDLLKGYYRNLQQSQPNHIEVVCEKNTVEGILRPVARDFRITLTSGRGFCSLPPRYEMAQRFRKSGKEKLVILIASDFDPDGEEICHSFARSLRDDFDVDTVEAIKVALTYEQTQYMDLPSDMEAKASSSNYAKFAERYGTAAYEMEALQPEVLQDLLRQSIDSVMDVDRFNAEIDAEKEDAAHLDTVREELRVLMGDSFGGLQR